MSEHAFLLRLFLCCRAFSIVELRRTPNDVQQPRRLPYWNPHVVHTARSQLVSLWSHDHPLLSLPHPHLSPQRIPIDSTPLQITDEDIGTYVGLLTSSFFVGQIPGAFIWGRLGDLFGRKRIIIISLLRTIH